MKELAEESDNVSNQRLTMISVVLFVLLIVAGAGWLNSAKSMLVARRQECFHFNILAEFTWNCDVFVRVVDVFENNHKAINNMIVQRNMQNVSMERKMYEKNYSNRYNFYEKQ